jgi:hypothetical protein
MFHGIVFHELLRESKLFGFDCLPCLPNDPAIAEGRSLERRPVEINAQYP